MGKMLQIIRDTVRKISVKTKLSVKMLGAVLLLVTGAAVLIFSEFSEKKNVVAQAETTQSETDVREYTAELEERLVSIISAIDGAGETKVMVTLESGSEEIYLSNRTVKTAMSVRMNSLLSTVLRGRRELLSEQRNPRCAELPLCVQAQATIQCAPK